VRYEGAEVVAVALPDRAECEESALRASLAARMKNIRDGRHGGRNLLVTPVTVALAKWPSSFISYIVRTLWIHEPSRAR